MKKILIIGSTGYLGSVLVPYLQTKGYKVDGIDIGYYGAGEEDYGDNINILGFDIIILLAGHSSPSLCENDKWGSYLNNCSNFARLIQLMTKNQRLLYASSASVCNGMKNAYEDDALRIPISHYDMQKQVIEKIVSVSECETVGMRFGTIAGYSPNPRLDSAINSLYYDAVNKGEMTVSNGENYRSYLGMNDACKAIEALIEVEKPYNIYNIASGTSSISYIAERIAKMTKAKINNIGGNNKYSFWVNVNRINRLVNLNESIEDICENMGDMIKFDKSIYNRNTNLFKY